MADVLVDRLGILTYCINVISSAPELSVPVLVLHVAPFLVYHEAALSLQISHKA